jgi:sulfotransferase family protein
MGWSEGRSQIEESLSPSLGGSRWEHLAVSARPRSFERYEVHVMTNPVVFIVGCPRSGTTLLRRIVSAHPEMVITPEAQWIPLWFEKRRGLTRDGLVTPELIPELLAHDKFSLFQLGPEELLSLAGNGQPMSYASFVTGIFDLYGKARAKELVGNKTPDSVRRMGTLHALWPQARFIHLIRDGRDVALSLMSWPSVRSKKPGTFPTWKDDPVSTSAFWWELNVRRGREAGEWLGPELYREMRYESLVAHPEQECAALCDFLGLAYDEAMLHYHEAFEEAGGGQGARHDRQPITSGLRNWRTEMSADDVERFEAVAGALLDELGYPRTFARPRTAAVEHSTQVRSLLAKKLARCSSLQTGVSLKYD